MNTGYKFDKTARTERYFVGTLFAHLLMAKDFALLKTLFIRTFGEDICMDLTGNNDFELVSEIDPLRDGSVVSKNVKALYKEFRRIAVPDLFLRWSNLCIILEAKFFTDPSESDILEQIKLQMKAISAVKQFTSYNDFRFKFVSLTVKTKKLADTTIVALNWDDVFALIDTEGEESLSFSYAKMTIQHALERASAELRSKRGITFTRKSFSEIMTGLSELVEEGRVFIGFTGGISKLSSTRLDELTDRSHYKVSDVKWGDNWLSLDVFLRRIFELRGLFHQYDDDDE